MWVTLSGGVEKADTIDEKKITGIIANMQNDGGIHGLEAISYEAETEGRNEHK